MEKLFSESEIFMKERPTKMSTKQSDDYDRQVAEEIVHNGWSSSPIQDIITDVKNISLRHNGYEIAKELERNGKAVYDINTLFIEFLDDYEFGVRRIIGENVRMWVAAHNPTAKFVKGQKLIVTKSLNYEMKKDTLIYVTGFNEKEACYVVNENPDANYGVVIPYERIENCCEPI